MNLQLQYAAVKISRYEFFFILYKINNEIYITF